MCPGESHLRLVVDGAHHVTELGPLADDARERLAEDVQERGLHVLLEKERRHLDRQFGVCQGDRTNPAEPHLELLWLHVLFNDAQAFVPDRYVSLLRIHLWRTKINRRFCAGSSCAKMEEKKVKKRFF